MGGGTVGKPLLAKGRFGVPFSNLQEGLLGADGLAGLLILRSLLMRLSSSGSEFCNVLEVKAVGLLAGITTIGTLQNEADLMATGRCRSEEQNWGVSGR